MSEEIGYLALFLTYYMARFIIGEYICADCEYSKTVNRANLNYILSS